jgi:L-aspartate oxidase
MAGPQPLARYGRNLPLERAAAVEPADAVVVGAGVAGLAAALALRAPEGGTQPRVLVVSKRRLGEGGASNWAQGGVAAALAADDSPWRHAADTIAVAGGIADRAAVELLTGRGPRRLLELLARGARFDRDGDGELAFGREAAHSASRILHAGGDATGAEMVRALTAAVVAAPWIEVLEETLAEELLVEDGQVVGLVVRSRTGAGTRRAVGAGAVVLATGGIGQAWRFTTNPPEATGDGLAMAARAGARLADLEFMQFHPTALAGPRDPLPLLTEALRGEGAILVDGGGRRFMLGEHPLVELAPRDVVARAIFRRRQRGEAVFLDARRAVGERFPQRFPTVFARCREQGFDPRVDLLPVVPAAHYHMGGVDTDLRGRAWLGRRGRDAGLWACGEVASTGAHGANRLASNSLLEALVFGAEVGEDVVRAGLGPPDDRRVRRAAAALGGGSAARRANPARAPVAGSTDAGTVALRARLRQLLWDHVGLERDGDGLAHALAELDAIADEPAPADGELRNLVTVGGLVAAAALLREESRGAHWRRDAPRSAPSAAHRTLATADELLAAAAAVRSLELGLGTRGAAKRPRRVVLAPERQRGRGLAVRS